MASKESEYATTVEKHYLDSQKPPIPEFHWFKISHNPPNQASKFVSRSRLSGVGNYERGAAKQGLGWEVWVRKEDEVGEGRLAKEGTARGWGCTGLQGREMVGESVRGWGEQKEN